MNQLQCSGLAAGIPKAFLNCGESPIESRLRAAKRAAGVPMAALFDVVLTQDRCEVDRKEKLANVRAASELRIPSPGSYFIFKLRFKPKSNRAGFAGGNLVAATAAGSACATAAGAFACLVAIAAEDRTVAARFKGNRGRLTAARTDDRSSLSRCCTIAGSAPSLVVLLCLPAGFASFRGGISAFLEERLVCSCEGEILPAIAAR